MTALVAVVGGGPAGLSAAIAAARAGAETVLFDENPALGGRLRYQLDAIRNGIAAELVRAAVAAGVDLRSGSTVWGLSPDLGIGVVGGGASYEARADRVILATGSTDLPLPFPGGTLPGVFTARALLTLLHLHRVRPGKRFVVLGGDLANEIEEAVELAGGEVVARHDPAVSKEPVRAEGANGVTAVWIGTRRVAADVVVTAAGRQPDVQLAQMAEAALGYSAALGGWSPARSRETETSISGLFVAGQAAGICDIPTALAEGRLAGLAAAASLGLADRTEVERAAGELAHLAPARISAIAALAGSFVQGERPPAVQGEATAARAMGAAHSTPFVCRCEEVDEAAVRAAIAAGARSVNDVKRRTRAGMGLCQGIFCARTVANLLRDAGMTADEIVPMTARPPARILPLEQLAGGND